MAAILVAVAVTVSGLGRCGDGGAGSDGGDIASGGGCSGSVGGCGGSGVGDGHKLPSPPPPFTPSLTSSPGDDCHHPQFYRHALK